MYNELAHHGILGMKWGIRRYQNEDGSYTPAGKKRYVSDFTKKTRQDIASFKGHEKGITAKDGKVILSAKDVQKQITKLQDLLKEQTDEASGLWDLQVTASDIHKATAKTQRAINKGVTAKHLNAAVYVSKSNMTPKDALSRATKDQALTIASVTAGVIAGGLLYGAITKLKNS